MFNPYDPRPTTPTKPLPQRPPLNPFLAKIQDAAAQAAAAETSAAPAAIPFTEQAVPVPSFTQTPLEEVKPMSEFNPNDIIEAMPQAALAPVPEVTDDRTDSDLPAKAGIVDYRSGEGLPSVVPDADVKALEQRLDGVSFKATFPVTVKEPALGKDGNQRTTKSGKLMWKKVNVPTNVNALISGQEHMGFALDDSYCVSLVVEQMIYRVQGHMAAQDVLLKEGWMFDQNWLSTHFGTSNFMEAIEAELRPWATTKVSALSAATQAAMCSSVTDAEEIIAIYAFVEKAASHYLTKIMKGQGSKAAIAQQLAPITKAKAKWDQYVGRCEKALADGKAEPKAPVIKALTAETPKGIRAVVGVLTVADQKRQAMVEKFKAGNYPKDRFTDADVADVIDGAQEYSINMQTVGCWLGQIATNMQAAEQRKLQKYAADSAAAVAADDDFDLL